MKMAVNSAQTITRSDELKLIRELVKKAKKDPEVGIKIAREAGILDENGNLTKYYRERP